MNRDGLFRGVSPLVGTALLFLIMIMIVGVLVGFFVDLGPSETKPKVASEVLFYSEYNNSTNKTYHYMEVRHTAGDVVERDDISLVWNADSSESFISSGSGDFGVNDKLVYEITSNVGNVCRSNRNEVGVTVVDEGSSAVLSDTSVAVRGEGNGTAQISGNTVGSAGESRFTADVTVLGTGASASGGGDINGDAIHGRVVIEHNNGTTEYLTPWTDGDVEDSLDTSSPSGVYEDDIWSPDISGVDYTTKPLPSNSTVSVDMRSYKPSAWSDTGEDITRNGNTYDIRHGSGGISQYRFWVNSNNPSENNLVLLRDGDRVPALGQSLSWQQSLKDMLRERMNSSGHLQLDSNEIVAVYELNTEGASPGSSGDYNDAVVLIEVSPVQEKIVTRGEERHYIYCGN